MTELAPHAGNPASTAAAVVGFYLNSNTLEKGLAHAALQALRGSRLDRRLLQRDQRTLTTSGFIPVCPRSRSVPENVAVAVERTSAGSEAAAQATA